MSGQQIVGQDTADFSCIQQHLLLVANSTCLSPRPEINPTFGASKPDQWHDSTCYFPAEGLMPAMTHRNPSFESEFLKSFDTVEARYWIRVVSSGRLLPSWLPMLFCHEDSTLTATFRICQWGSTQCYHDSRE
jgi:hypothetical protein